MTDYDETRLIACVKMLHSHYFCLEYIIEKLTAKGYSTALIEKHYKAVSLEEAII